MHTIPNWRPYRHIFLYRWGYHWILPDASTVLTHIFLRIFDNTVVVVCELPGLYPSDKSQDLFRKSLQYDYGPLVHTGKQNFDVVRTIAMHSRVWSVRYYLPSPDHKVDQVRNAKWLARDCARSSVVGAHICTLMWYFNSIHIKIKMWKQVVMLCRSQQKAIPWMSSRDSMGERYYGYIEADENKMAVWAWWDEEEWGRSGRWESLF